MFIQSIVTLVACVIIYQWIVIKLKNAKNARILAQRRIDFDRVSTATNHCDTCFDRYIHWTEILNRRNSSNVSRYATFYAIGVPTTLDAWLQHNALNNGLCEECTENRRY